MSNPFSLLKDITDLNHKVIYLIMLKTLTNVLTKNFAKITNREALNRALDEELTRDPNVFIIG